MGFGSRVIVPDRGELVANGPLERLLGDKALMRAHGLERPHILWHRHPHTSRLREGVGGL